MWKAMMKRHRTYIVVNLEGIVMKVSNTQMVRYLEHLIGGSETELYGEVVGDIDYHLGGLTPPNAQHILKEVLSDREVSKADKS